MFPTNISVEMTVSVIAVPSGGSKNLNTFVRKRNSSSMHSSAPQTERFSQLSSCALLSSAMTLCFFVLINICHDVCGLCGCYVRVYINSTCVRVHMSAQVIPRTIQCQMAQNLKREQTFRLRPFLCIYLKTT